MDSPYREGVHAMNPAGTAVALAQGLWVRNRIEMLPPAGGATTGTIGPAGDQTLRLGVLGESTAAGCGVETHATGFTGALAERLSEDRRQVQWSVVGEHGATARRIRYRLLPKLAGEFDVVVLLAGANDVLARRSGKDWGEDLDAIVAHLSAVSRHVVVTGTPPFLAFPSLPRTLARYLAARGERLDSVSQAVCGGIVNAQFVAAANDLFHDDFFARDRFHPGERGYRHWAEVVADVLPPL
ncbi:SGNH/GDSL hydrolase family protein [Microbacterium sp.]|uniref:SGNH/GDSL hydrolase family protein n=1 Tax=Microbacterium sp. TaxID=51671 RepID=UPI00273406D2|nr:SGNH/GDSL hydrolase family protein [Microbacterium sp.]MDP3951957.1 SGNH/GDSL hydrolase family protein [Microbacterium sp.]